jgi:cathepsin L
VLSAAAVHAQTEELKQHFKDLKIPPAEQKRIIAAPSDVKVRIQDVLREASQKKVRFGVGYTAALNFKLEQLAGTRIPENFLEIAKSQNEFAEQARRFTKGLVLPKCSPSAAKFDWRSLGKVTPVRSQKACGSCWAFTAMGAYEGSYAIQNNQLVDTSEQHVLNCATYPSGADAGSCGGGWWHPVFSWMLAHGVAAEATVPYQAVDQACVPGLPAPYRAINWGFVSAQNAIPPVEAIQKALCEHGPLAVAVRVTPLFQAYTGLGPGGSDVFVENDTGPINHGVTLVGWDDTRKAWLIKNSWSENWGIKGYMWIGYGSNSIGYAAAWVTARPAKFIVSADLLKLMKEHLKLPGEIRPFNPPGK